MGKMPPSFNVCSKTFEDQVWLKNEDFLKNWSFCLLSVVPAKTEQQYIQKIYPIIVRNNPTGWRTPVVEASPLKTRDQFKISTFFPDHTTRARRKSASTQSTTKAYQLDSLQESVSTFSPPSSPRFTWEA